MAGAAQQRSLAAWAWVAVAAAAIFELFFHHAVLAAIPSDASWDQAAAFVRARHTDADRIVSAPEWVDPIVRQRLGDLSSLREAAPPDLAGFHRVWEVGLSDATTRSDPPALEHAFGGVRVRMWPMESPEVLYDFVDALPDAKVRVQAGEDFISCPWVRAKPGRGGLERGPMMPAERFVCDRRRRWLWVGATILTDLDLAPRRCIWQHPSGPDPVQTVFADVPIGPRLVVHGGIDYQVERDRAHAPVALEVWIDDVLAGTLLHRDGDGWSTLEIDTSSLLGKRASVRFDTTTPDPTARLFCYAASIQSAGSDE